VSSTESREATCGNCPNLIVGAMNCLVCEPEDAIVPHDFDGETYILWRVPVFCPREDSEVVKSEKMAAKKQWVKRNKSDFIK